MTKKFVRDGVALNVDGFDGPGAIVFQHGLCGDARQPADMFPVAIADRRLTLECRGHGGSEAGDPTAFSIATFTDDLAALIEARGFAPCVVGGISMGAAIALRLAVMRPDLVRALVLARPAWVAEPAPPNMAPNLLVGDLLAAHSAAEARELFERTDTVARLMSDAPDNLASLRGFFGRAPQAVTAELLRRISADGPGIDRDQVRGIAMPVLVIGHGRDAVHPLAFAETLAGLIPGAWLDIIPPKADDPDGYREGFRAALDQFLQECDR